MYSDMSAIARSLFLYIRFLMRSFFKLLKNDSATALSQQLPRRLILGSSRLVRQKRRQSSLLYTAIGFGNRCTRLGVRPSMGSVGDCFDNAMAESVFATLECEVLDRNAFQTRDEARSAIFSWIEGWYNTHRRHSSLGYLSPQEFERRFTQIHTRRASAASCGQTALLRNSVNYRSKRRNRQKPQTQDYPWKRGHPTSTSLARASSAMAPHLPDADRTPR